MSKKVVWGTPKIASANQRGYKSYKDFLKKANAMKQEQEEAQAYLAKAMPAMVKLLEIRLEKGHPLTVMRPLRYQTCAQPGEEEDDGFYNVSKSMQGPQKFVDIVKTIMPGTRLMLKSLDVGLNEFVFEDGMGNEHAISFEQRNALLTQTDIFETVKNYFEANKGE